MLKNFLGGAVLRMRLSGENELDGPFAVINDLEQTVDVAQYQIPSLVRGNATRKADRQRFG